MLGLRLGFRAGSTYYKETGTEPLQRAISRKGSGVKQYRVTFPDGSKRLIHCTPDRVYADITGPQLLNVYALVADRIRPGMRILDAASGTGYSSAWLAGMVGPSGAVVALEADEESHGYAAVRYASPNVAFERKVPGCLDGETNGAFDAVLFVSYWTDPHAARNELAELWRLVLPGGWLLISLPEQVSSPQQSQHASSEAPPLLGFSAHDLPQLVSDVCAGTVQDPKPDFEGVEILGEASSGRMSVLLRKADL